MDNQARERVTEIIACELQLPREKVRTGLSLRKDLGMDSVAALNIVFAAEEAFGIRIPEVELEAVDDVDAIIDLVERHRRPASQAAYPA